MTKSADSEVPQGRADDVLRMNSPAPPIEVESWLRGQPLASFEPGTVYIVEFWATWCGPCVAAMPHLVQLQETYRDSGLEIVGVAASEHAPTADEARTTLEAWLADKFPNLNFRIAFDHTGEMKELWMEASLAFGIPTAFVVDRDGHIAFIGHPMQLDDVLPKVLNGSWRTSDDAKAADLERIAEGQREARKSALVKPILAKLRPAMQAEDWTTALAAVEEGVAVVPDNPNFRRAHADLLLHKMRDMRTGLPVMRQLVRDAIGTKSEPWMAMAMELLFDPAKDNCHLPQAERFAMGKELAEQILVLNPPHGNGPKYASYGAVAQYYCESGNTEHAIELVELGLNSVGHPEPMPDDLKPFYVPRLLQALANCTGEKACYGDFCVAPQAKFAESVEAQPPEEET
ncbi:TlpA family protein disulfide reductase [Microvirga tunisiensis]|uniref:TlpA family protein disulfide reductase n=2 Tax=Microvirga tunisiensis TaxID=2108360 RepID=A0A5N7MVV2_9HYPH|nr:TlpA family protein disulfide reductase [Microvirga tunisiensis]MPR31028.1 TlpA family protein disulfide reductase [Microvirga tunisiensis]